MLGKRLLPSLTHMEHRASFALQSVLSISLYDTSHWFHIVLLNSKKILWKIEVKMKESYKPSQLKVHVFEKFLSLLVGV